MTISAQAVAPATPARTQLTVTRTVLAAEAILAEVMQAYSLDLPTGCELLKFHTNDTYLLNTVAGPYILRLYGARCRLVSEINYELAFLRHVASKGLTVSLPIAARDGAWTYPVYAAEGTRHLVVFTYVIGSPLTWKTHAECRIAGRSMAQLHAAADDFECEHERRSLDLAELIDRPLAVLHSFVKSRPEAWDFLQRLGIRLRDQITALAAEGLDWGACHGDVAIKNLLQVADDELAFLDFDHCGPGWRAHDFAQMFGDAAWAKRTDLWEAFWDGYVEQRSLGAADKRAVPIFLTAWHLFMLGMMAENSPNWGTVAIRGTNLDGWLTFLQDCERKYLQ